MRRFTAILTAVFVFFNILTVFADYNTEYIESGEYAELSACVSGNDIIGAFVDYKTLVDRYLAELTNRNSAERQRLITDILTQAGTIYVNEDEIDFTRTEYADYFAYAVANIAETERYLNHHGIAAVARFPITVDFGSKKSVKVAISKWQFSKLYIVTSGMSIKNNGITVNIDDVLSVGMFEEMHSEGIITVALIRHNKKDLPENFAHAAKSDNIYQLVFTDGDEVTAELPDVNIAFYSTSENDRFYSLREEQDGSVSVWPVNSDYTDGTSAFVVNGVRIFGIYSAKDAAVQTFTDVPPDHWAYEYIEKLADRGIVSGKGDGLFDPDGAVTREEFVKMFTEGLGLTNPDAKCTFDDVAEDAWYYPHIASAYELGAVTGFSEHSFGVGENITRGDLAAVIVRTLESIEKPFAYTARLQFGVADPYIPYHTWRPLNVMLEAGIMSVDENNEIRPLDHATRAEVAKILCLVMEHTENF